MPVLGAYQTSEVLLGNLQVDRKKNLPELGSETDPMEPPVLGGNVSSGSC